MVDSGLLLEVYIFHPDSDYTRGLKQAIGVREFEDFLKAYLSKCDSGTQDGMENLKENMNVILSTFDETPLKQLLEDAIDKVKLNTRMLCSPSGFSEESWTANVVKPSIQIIKSYFDKDVSFEASNGTKGCDLCKACGDKVLRGSYEWEQHKQRRIHRKRIC